MFGCVLVTMIVMLNATKALAQQKPSLQQSYNNFFLIGTAINAPQILEKDPKAAAIITNDFNSITPENIMKSEIIHPKWDEYDFNLADKMIEYAQAHQIKVNGHTLIWHSQLPAFMKYMQSADSVRNFFVNHIETVTKRYDRKIFSWDVVNEALEEDGSLRKSIFLEKLDHIGDDICYKGVMSPEENVKFCDELNDCIAFNTLGYFKHSVDMDNLKQVSIFGEKDGLFLNIKKYKEKYGL